MDKKPEQPKLFELKQENKILTEEEIKNSADKKTGQLKFISPELELKAMIREEMEPVIEANKLLSEKSDRLLGAFEKAIPHFQNKMMGNEDEAYLAYADNPEQADVVRVSSDKIPADAVYTMISAELASAFGCKSCYVSYLLKDLNLWNDNKYTKDEKISVNNKIKKFRPAILNEVYKQLPDLLNSNKFHLFTENRKNIYIKIYETMKFYRS
ncbi:MAG: hypothetical protein PHC34_01555 [Candidatus Gastranaerophilales bacterium]|nr:hypothetical protein [Candidatus Gastranaerophilales bacterium]